MTAANPNRDQIPALYAQGLSVGEIADLLGYKKSSPVSRYLSDHGIERRPTRGEHDGVITRMKREKRTVREIMAATGLTERGVYVAVYRLRQTYDFDAPPVVKAPAPRNRPAFSCSPSAIARALAATEARA